MIFYPRNKNGRVGEPKLTDDNNILVASLLDLSATKCKVIMQRVEKKDYTNLAHLFRNKKTLSNTTSVNFAKIKEIPLKSKNLSIAGL